MNSRFYKVKAGMHNLDRTFIVHIKEEHTLENLTERISELLSGWYIYDYREIEFNDLEIVTYW